MGRTRKIKLPDEFGFDNGEEPIEQKRDRLKRRKHAEFFFEFSRPRGNCALFSIRKFLFSFDCQVS
jgi:hypothetical protein